MLIFLHIPKAAGSTLKRVIRKEYLFSSIYRGLLLNDKDNVLSLRSPRFVEEGITNEPLKHIESISENRRARVKVLTGHFCFGIHKYFEQPVKYITILRDPISRVYSLYNYIFRTEKHNLHNLLISKNMTFEEFLRSGITTEVDNIQTRLLFGLDSHKIKFGETYPGMLDQAKENLKRYFSVVGLTEDFDRTFLLMREKLNWHSKIYRNHNVAPRSSKKEIPANLREMIKEYNQLDIQLYNFAKEIFKKQLSSIPDVEKKLLKLRNTNIRYAKYCYPIIQPFNSVSEKIVSNLIVNKR